MDGRRPARAGAQNPAYRPTRPPPTTLTCDSIASWALGALSRHGSIGAAHVDAAEDAEGVDSQCRCPSSADTGLDVRAAEQVEAGHHDVHLTRNDQAYAAHR